MTAITSAQMWEVTGVVAVVDIVLGVLLSRMIRPPWPPKLSPTLLILGTCGFAVLFGWAFWTYWSSCYAAALPPWVKPLAPLLGATEGALGWVFWGIARKASRGAVALFLVLGGLESLPGHLHAVYGRRLLEHCLPVLGVSPASALVLAFFEYAFYWSVILLLSTVVARVIVQRGTRTPLAR